MTVFYPKHREFERNDELWRRLFLSSKNQSYDMDKIWTSYESKLLNPSGEIHESVMEIVNFAAPNVMTVIDDERAVQQLTACTKTKMKKLNRQRVILNGNQIDVFDHLRSFAYDTILKPNTLDFETNFDVNAVPQAKWKNENV